MRHAEAITKNRQQQIVKSSAATASVQGYFESYQQTLETLFLERLIKIKPHIADELITHFLPLRAEAMADTRNITFSSETRQKRADARYERYEALYTRLDTDQPLRLAITEAQAKLQDICSIARKQSTVNALKMEHGQYGASADDITYTLMHFKNQKPSVVAADVQRYLDEISAKFSLTSHPTNSTSVAHTKAAITLECSLANPETTRNDLHAAMDAFINAPVAAERKTPLDELEELIPIMDNLYDAALIQRDAIITALGVSGYGDEKNGVKLRTPMLDLEDWSATFDGDGNANATRKALEKGVARKQEWIKGRYSQTLDKMKDAVKNSHYGQSICEDVENIKKKLNANEYGNIEQFASELEDMQANYAVYDSAKIPHVDDLIYLTKIFGFQGSVGNIRHDAKTLQETLALLIREAGIQVDASVLFDKDRLSILLNTWFDEPDKVTLNKLKEAATHTPSLRAALGEKDDDTSLRIIERLQFLGEQPDVANKLIIAEATHPADAKAAMALLYATGNEVANKKANAEIVLLVESVADVECLDETIKTLAKDPVYQKHLEAMGRITVMIAHSDNRRRDGYSAGEIITSMEGKIAKLQEDLHIWAVRTECQPLLNIADSFGVPIYIFDGGGNDLMRGAAVNPGQTGKQHGHAAAREKAPTIRTPQNTIQGEQARLLFGYPECAAMFLEMMVSQTMYAKAAVENRIKVPDYTLEPSYLQDQQSAKGSSVNFHKTARKMFHHHTDAIKGEENPFDALFTHSGAWITTLLANRGSRSNQRGESKEQEDQTVEQLRGTRRALDQRAITGNLLFQLTGTFHLGLLGQLEAFEEIGTDKARQMYLSSLPDRTHIVGIAQQLHMTDFGKAWKMMGEEHPTRAERESMADAFKACREAGSAPTPLQTLAYMEDYGLKLAETIVQVGTGKHKDDALFTDTERPFEIQDAYRSLLPELARQLDVRHASHEAENAAIARREQIFSEYPDVIVPHAMQQSVIALSGALSMDVRPALGPLAVRGSKGVATTPAEKAVAGDEKPQPDIRYGIGRYSTEHRSAGVRESFADHIAVERLHVPSHIIRALENEHTKNVGKGH